MSNDGWAAPGGDADVSDGPRTTPAPPGSSAAPTPAPATSGPVPPASVPPGRGGRTAALVLVVVLSVVAVVGGAFVVVTVAGSDDRPTSEDDDRAPVDDSSAAHDGGEDASDSALMPFADPEGQYEISVPATWVAVSTRFDVRGLGAEHFPDDPRRARYFDELLAALPRPVTFTALPPEELGTAFVTNVNVVLNEPPSGATDLDAIAEDATRQVETTAGVRALGEPTRVDLPAGEAVRIVYEIEDAGAAVQYLVPQGGSVWTVTMNTGDLGRYEASFDTIAATFSLTDGTATAAGRVTARDGSFSVELGEPWVAAYPESGTSVGTQLAPDDPDAAAELSDRMWAITNGFTRLVVADGDKVDEGFEGLVFDHISFDPTAISLDTLVEMAQPNEPGAVGEEGRLTGQMGEIAWFESSTGLFVTYVVASATSAWNITYWAADIDVRRAEIDGIVRSFVSS